MDHDDMLLIRSQSTTRGHSRKLFPKNYRINVRKHFFLWTCYSSVELLRY